jgi:hypothetical protein
MFSPIKFWSAVTVAALLVALLLIPSGNPAAARGGQAPAEGKVTIRHPRHTNVGDKAMPPIFVAAVKVKAPAAEVDLTNVSVAILNKHNMTPSGSVVKALKVAGHAKAAFCRLFILVKVPPAPDPALENPYKLKVGVKLGTEVESDIQVFEIKVPGSFGINVPEGKVGIKGTRGGYGYIHFYYPVNGYVIAGDERDYFVPCGPGNPSPATAYLGGAPGAAHWNNDDPLNPIWWVEFSDLTNNPSPGGPYTLIVTNTDGEPVSRTVYVSQN